MANPKRIAEIKSQLSGKTEEELVATQIETRDSTDLVLHIAVTQLLQERQRVRHGELIAEIKRPHWSVTPSFYLLVLSVLLAAAALFVALSQQPQGQSPAVAVSPSTQAAQPALLPSANSPQPLPSTAPSPSRPQKNGSSGTRVGKNRCLIGLEAARVLGFGHFVGSPNLA